MGAVGKAAQKVIDERRAVQRSKKGEKVWSVVVARVLSIGCVLCSACPWTLQSWLRSLLSRHLARPSRSAWCDRSCSPRSLGISLRGPPVRHQLRQPPRQAQAQPRHRLRLMWTRCACRIVTKVCIFVCWLFDYLFVQIAPTRTLQCTTMTQHWARRTLRLSRCGCVSALCDRADSSRVSSTREACYSTRGSKVDVWLGVVFFDAHFRLSVVFRSLPLRCVKARSSMQSRLQPARLLSLLQRPPLLFAARSARLQFKVVSAASVVLLWRPFLTSPAQRLLCLHLSLRCQATPVPRPHSSPRHLPLLQGLDARDLRRCFARCSCNRQAEAEASSTRIAGLLIAGRVYFTCRFRLPWCLSRLALSFTRAPPLPASEFLSLLARSTRRLLLPSG